MFHVGHPVGVLRIRLLDACVFVVTAIAVLAVLLIGQPLGLATSRRAEPHTELYFSSPTTMTITNGRAPVSFTVRNAEGRATSYVYTVYLDDRRAMRVRTPVVPSAGSLDVTRSLRVPARAKTVQLRVGLAGGQTIRARFSRG